MPKAKKQKKSRRNSVEERLDTMSSTLNALKDLVVKGGLTGTIGSMNNSGGHKMTNPSKMQMSGLGKLSVIPTENSVSDTTIYHNALNKINQRNVVVTETGDPDITFKVTEESLRTKGNISSDEDKIDTSDETIDVELNQINVNEFIADCASEARRRREELDMIPEDHDERNVIDQTDEIIREAEASKARILATPGKCYHRPTVLNDHFNGGSATQHSSLVDENYLVIGGNIEPSLHEKIVQGEYIDFARLLQKSKNHQEDGKLELVNRGGQTYFIPANRELNGGITSFHKWEQAFRVFSNIYTKEFPERATELIQYNHIIFMASSTYIWDNVYTYDKEFRTHLSFFPERSRAIILQQAWSMYLKDRVIHDHSNRGGSGNFFKSKKEVCIRFNCGQCMAGRSCKFEHRCLECGKFGQVRLSVGRKRLGMLHLEME